ncbi:GNAT family N-acetyltransferase [Mangrovimonas aestuarii]|uniref:GNAT family N-acetyltransferase n=1 Tax=Mangrovimonas aestuarii TaxID=3018443 RepID=UPI002377E3B1|nr:GNAT family N-acetyltransferase [Mangrovimonas aestuarii]
MNKSISNSLLWVNSVSNLIKDGEFKQLFNGLTKRLYSNTQSFGLKRDLEIPFEAPKANIQLKIRPANNSDMEAFRKFHTEDRLLSTDIPQCYVATTSSNEVCYRQWLMGSKQNDKIRYCFGKTFPKLKPDEALLEGAFTLPNYRGKKIMPEAMARIAEKGNELGVKYIVTFVNINNIPSLKGCKRSGFNPYVVRNERFFLFFKSTSFSTIPKRLKALYEQYTS